MNLSNSRKLGGGDRILQAYFCFGAYYTVGSWGLEADRSSQFFVAGDGRENSHLLDSKHCLLYERVSSAIMKTYAGNNTS